MNIAQTVILIAVLIGGYTIAYIVGLKTCRERIMERLLDTFFEELEGEKDDK